MKWHHQTLAHLLLDKRPHQTCRETDNFHRFRRQGELEVLDQVEQDGLHLNHASVRVRIRGICAG